MDWGFILQVTLAVLGVALMVGGIVAYRGSARTGVRSFAAAGIASGVVMLAIVVMTVPVYRTSDGPPGPVIDLTDGSPPPGSISGVGPGISIGEAFTSNLTGPLLINGFLHAQDGQVRLCEWLAESLPPQCGARFLVVQGLDLTTMSGLTSEGSVTWSDQLVQVLGTVEGEVLTVAGTASSGSPLPSLKFGDVNYVYSGSAELPSGEGADFVINGTEITMDDLERIGTTNEGNTAGIQDGLVVYRLKDDGANDVYTFTPGEDHLNPEDGQIFKGQDVWTRWTTG